MSDHIMASLGRGARIERHDVGDCYQYCGSSDFYHPQLRWRQFILAEIPGDAKPGIALFDEINGPAKKIPLSFRNLTRIQAVKTQ